ncbi:MAG: hypothetical protein H0U71_02360 [Gammaproteobacteria bacterium]|nr:hypothetical protein [Gammaproteobacteria bacterium]
MKALKTISILFACCITISVFGVTQSNEKTLKRERIETIREYLQSLSGVDSRKINLLFEANGTVISTSKGEIDEKSFFNGFLSDLTSASVKNTYIYQAINDENHYGGRFNFSWVEKNGTSSGGTYMDDFIFVNGSKKLEKVIMFENKQLKP